MLKPQGPYIDDAYNFETDTENEPQEKQCTEEQRMGECAMEELGNVPNTSSRKSLRIHA